MPAPLIKLLPNTILIIVFGYLAWSNWNTTPLPAAPGDALPEISANVLRPQPPEPTLRDPFGQSVRFQLGEFKKPDSRRGGAAVAAKKPDATSGTPTPRATQGGTAAHSPTVAATGAATVAVSAATSPPPDPDLKLPADFVLNATVLSERHNFAVINDKAYRTGEKLPETESKTWIVKDVRRHGVLLALGEQALELKYPDESEGHGGGGPSPARGAGPAPRPTGQSGGSKRPTNMKDIVIPGATHR